MKKFLAVWLADDKGAHAGLSSILYLALRHLTPGAAAVALAVGLAWEVVEDVRFMHWVRHGMPLPRPQVCDLADWRDVVADLLGIVAAALLA